MAESTLTLSQVTTVLEVLFDGADLEYAWRPFIKSEIDSFRAEVMSKASAILVEAQARGA